MRIQAHQRCPRTVARFLDANRLLPAEAGAPGLESRSAFSLIEILCAVLILAVALTGMIQGVTTALSSTKDSEVQTVAALFAAGQIEALRAEGGLQDGATEGDCGE